MAQMSFKDGADWINKFSPAEMQMEPVLTGAMPVSVTKDTPKEMQGRVLRQHSRSTKLPAHLPVCSFTQLTCSVDFSWAVQVIIWREMVWAFTGETPISPTYDVEHR